MMKLACILHLTLIVGISQSASKSIQDTEKTLTAEKIRESRRLKDLLLQRDDAVRFKKYLLPSCGYWYECATIGMEPGTWRQWCCDDDCNIRHSPECVSANTDFGLKNGMPHEPLA